MTVADPYRLPLSVTPHRYDLTLEPDLAAATFHGVEAVHVEVHEPVNEIVINAQDLEIDEAWLEGVETFNFHPHLPHYAITASEPGAIHLLAQQPIDTSRPHPFTEAGHREFNMFLWMPPTSERPGDILLADSTIFTTLFGGDASLERFWKNIATK